jgi:hypothetical protein
MKPFLALLSLLFWQSIGIGADGSSVSRPLPPVDLPRLTSNSVHSHEITASDLLAVRAITGAAISPDGRWVALAIRQADLDRNDYRTALLIADANQPGHVANLGSVGPASFSPFYVPLIIDPVWSPDSRYVLYVTPELDREGKFGTWQLFRFSRDGKGLEQLTHCPRDVLYAIWLSDGRILVSMRGERAGFRDLQEKYFDHGIPYFGLNGPSNPEGSISPAGSDGAFRILDQALNHMNHALREPATFEVVERHAI